MASQLAQSPQVIRFGEGFELDPCLRELRHLDRVLKLERIPMDLLLLLLEYRGQIVSREQIVEKIWGKGIFFDADNSINGAIRKIRQVLKDNPEKPRFVRTITGKGYCFIAPSSDSPTRLRVSVAPLGSQIDRAHLGPPFRTHRLIVIVAAVLLLTTLGGYTRFHPKPRPPAPPTPPRLMLAVLPFENLTGDATQDYFSDGFTEEMITQLGRLDPQHVGVIARTSVMRYKDTHQPLAQIGRELGVQYVLEGSVRRDANTIRITSQLIQVKDQTHLWAREYDRELLHLLALQGEIAQEIADEIRTSLGVSRPAVRAGAKTAVLSRDSYEAYDLYLRGRYFWNKRTAKGFQQAIDYFQRSIVKDPNYARAYAGLADTYALMSSYSGGSPHDLMPKARETALKALQIDNGLAEAHTSLALIAETYDWDWTTAEKQFKRAIELAPNYATAHQWYAEYLAFQGRFDEALEEIGHARRLDPLSLIIVADSGAILYFSRQYDRAIQEFRSVLTIEPNFNRAELVIFAEIENGQLEQALADTKQWRRFGDAPWVSTAEACVYGRWGNLPRARHAVSRVQALTRSVDGDLAAMLATAYAGMGDKEQAIAWIEKAIAERSNLVVTLKVDPVFDPLRGDTRFKDSLRRIGFEK